MKNITNLSKSDHFSNGFTLPKSRKHKAVSRTSSFMTNKEN